jgi:SAM-dependent methyltransferase
MAVIQELAGAESQQLAAWERRVEEMIRAKGGQISAREFQAKVNVLFHDLEAAEYDEVHREIWESSLPVFEQLAKDITERSPISTDMVLADIGCGTGAATSLLLETELKRRIRDLRLVDTSPVMLQKCRARAARWGLPSEIICGTADELPTASIDVAMTSSVLHHIPSLIGFCEQINRSVKPGGFYIHLFDPPRRAAEPASLEARRRRYRHWLRRKRLWLAPLTVSKRVARYLVSKSPFRQGYIPKLNKQLIDQGIIKSPLSASEVWSITDLRANDLPYSMGGGICTEELRFALQDFEPVAIRTYGFFGVLSSNLPAAMAREEHELFEQGNQDGAFLAGVWRKRG